MQKTSGTTLLPQIIWRYEVSIQCRDNRHISFTFPPPHTHTHTEQILVTCATPTAEAPAQLHPESIRSHPAADTLTCRHLPNQHRAQLNDRAEGVFAVGCGCQNLAVAP